MLAFELFEFCPRCAQALMARANPLRCGCGFQFFFNPTVAAAAFVYDSHGRVIVIRRDKEPQRGKLTIPGGFLDIGETAEDGLAREVREEVGLEIDTLRFLCSEPNRYEFNGVTYPVCDLIFTARATNETAAQALDGASEFHWVHPQEISDDSLAFASVKKGLKLL